MVNQETVEEVDKNDGTRYFVTNGFYGSPVNGGASFCDRHGLECILRFFKKFSRTA